MDDFIPAIVSLIIGVVIAAWVVRQLKLGSMRTHTGLHHLGGKDGKWIKREDAPSKYWMTIVMESIAALAFIFFALHVLFLK